jgi:hypothetical protein
MLKTTFTGKSRLGLLLCLTGLLSFATSFTVRAQGAYDSQPAYDDSRRGDDNSTVTLTSNGADGNYTNDNVDQASPDAQDPPSRVARLSYFDGSVSLQPGGSGDWGAAARNRPVTIGDKLWVDKDARAELQAGQASIHLGAMTALSFLNLDQNIMQMRLAEGSINFRVRELREGDQYEVDTPNVAFTVREAGAFRIDVNENGDGTIITVLRGEGEVTAAGKTYDVRAGELAEFNGTDGNVGYRTERAPEPDELDRWASDRDRKEDDSVSARYVSRDTVGYSDLDDNGTWNEEPEYGHVWYPNQVSVGWAPYSYGYWNWVGPWGWTWNDYSPWGFAPFHYGRWNYFGNRWGWCPGPIGYSPVYGPAFVGFLGGHDFGFGLGLGVGWFPLGFGEVYRPWYRYHAGGAYIRNINIHNTNIRNVNIINNRNIHTNYAYARNPNAVTATSHNAFVNGQLVNRGGTRVTAASLRGAQVTNRVGLTPTRASYVGAVNARGRVATPPASVQNRAVIARTAPAAGASHMPVRTVSPGLGANRVNGSVNNGRGFNNSNRAVGNSTIDNGANAPGRQLQTNRPPSVQSNSRANGSFNDNASQPRVNSSNRPATSYQNRAPNNSASTNVPTMRSRSDRPSWAGSGANPNSSVNSQSATRPNNNRAPSMDRGRTYNDQGASSPRNYPSPDRTYSAPSRTYNDRGATSPRPYSAPQRQYSAPPRSYNDRGAAPQRSYSAPPRTYSAPSRTYSAPSQSAPSPNRGSSAPSGRSGGGGNGGSNPHGPH